MDVPIYLPLDGINRDRVAVLDDRQRPAHIRLGCDMPDYKPVASAGKSSVGDQSHLFAQALAHHGGGRGKHLAHAGSALGSFKTDDDHIARLDRAIENTLE